MAEKFTFFWSGPHSQWSSSPFTVPVMGEPMPFNCAEQYMMWAKAMTFRDLYRADMILRESDPSRQKAWGRQVRRFDQDTWDAVADEIVFHGNLAKYTQNEQHREALAETIGTTLVEASPYDTIWGIGLTEDDPRAQSRDTWLGANRLGEIITKVRIQIFG